jgi:hypothetical protein
MPIDFHRAALRVVDPREPPCTDVLVHPGLSGGRGGKSPSTRLDPVTPINSITVSAPPLLFAVVMVVDVPTTVRRSQGAQQRAAGTSDQSTAKRIVAQQVASRRPGPGPKRTTRRRAPLGMVQGCRLTRGRSRPTGKRCPTSGSCKCLIADTAPACSHLLGMACDRHHAYS